jgi:hypothetical protein
MLCPEVSKTFITNINTKTNLFCTCHTIISYGIICQGNSSYANKVFILQKKIIRIITNAGPRESFRNMQILTLYSQHIYSVLLFTVNNRQLFTINKEIHEY